MSNNSDDYINNNYNYSSNLNYKIDQLEKKIDDLTKRVDAHKNAISICLLLTPLSIWSIAAIMTTGYHIFR